MGRAWGRSGSPLATTCGPASVCMLISTHASQVQFPGLRTVYNNLARSTQKGSAGRSINQIRLPSLPSLRREA